MDLMIYLPVLAQFCQVALPAQLAVLSQAKEYN